MDLNQVALEAQGLK